MQQLPELPDEGEALLDALEPLAERLVDGVAVDWEAAESSELTVSHKGLLQQLREIAQIASAHSGAAREASAPLDAVAIDTGAVSSATAARGDLRTWGQLILRSHLGRGSFGDVYRAWDPRLDREVALKLLPAPATGETARSSVVISEGRALARVRHPNVVTVYGADHINGRIGVWMECVEGRTLAQRIAAEGPLAPAEAAAIGADLARALAAVHKAGLLHRDVKAQNVMCEAGGRIVLTDFGTAIPHEAHEPAGDAAFEATPATDTPPNTISQRPPTLAGTPLYLAPEVLEGAPQTPQSDIYALGVLLFHALTGTFPVTGRTLRDVHDRHREGQRARLSQARPDLPPALVSVVDRALDPDPAARSQTAEEIARDLDAVAADAVTSPPPPRVRRRTWAVAAAIALAAAGAAAWLGGAVPSWRTGTAVATGPDLVLIASFENTSGDARAGQLVERALREAVAKSRAFAVATPDRMNKVRGYMRRAPDSTLDAASAREAALRDGGIRAVITGSIAGTSDQPAVEVHIVSPVSGATVGTIKEAAAGGEMARMLDALRAGVAASLDARLEALPSPVAQYEQVTTASFEALRTYSEGRAEFERRNHRGAAERFLRAIESDPDFALAHTWLGWSRFNSDNAAYDEAFAKGDELAHALSPEERLWARGSHLYGLKNHQEANAAFWALLQLDPLHFWALSNLDNYLRADLREYEWVISFWEQQAAARPNDLRTLHRTARALLTYDERAHRAWPYFDRFLELTKDGPDGGDTGVDRAFALLAPAWDAWARGRVSLAAERRGPVCDAPTGGPANVQWVHDECARMNLTLGQLQRADSHVPDARDQVYVALFRGDRETLKRLYESNPALYWWVGPLVGIVDDGGHRDERRVTLNFTVHHFVDLARGPSPETLQWFAERWRMSPSANPPRLAEVYAHALERVGDRSRAIEVLQTATSDRRATIGRQGTAQWIWARNAYAELLRRLGRDAEAESVERDLLAMLSGADAGHVIAARLRARYGGSAPRPTP